MSKPKRAPARNHAGRKPIGDSPRTVKMRVLLTESEAQLLSDRARASGRTASDYLVRSALGGRF